MVVLVFQSFNNPSPLHEIEMTRSVRHFCSYLPAAVYQFWWVILFENTSLLEELGVGQSIVCVNYDQLQPKQFSKNLRNIGKAIGNF